jgi:hypothetical protein
VSVEESGDAEGESTTSDSSEQRAETVINIADLPPADNIAHAPEDQSKLVNQILEREERIRRSIRTLEEKTRARVEGLRNRSSGEHDIVAPPSTPTNVEAPRLVVHHHEPAEQTDAGRGRAHGLFLGLGRGGTGLAPPHPRMGMRRSSQKRLYDAQNEKYDAIKSVLGGSISGSDVEADQDDE